MFNKIRLYFLERRVHKLRKKMYKYDYIDYLEKMNFFDKFIEILKRRTKKCL